MFSRGRERVHWEAFSNIQLNEYLLTLAKSITYYGVEIEETFSWNNQMKVPAKKFSRSYEILSKLSYYIPTETLTSIYYSLFKWHFYIIQQFRAINLKKILCRSSLSKKHVGGFQLFLISKNIPHKFSKTLKF